MGRLLSELRNLYKEEKHAQHRERTNTHKRAKRRGITTGKQCSSYQSWGVYLKEHLRAALPANCLKYASTRMRIFASYTRDEVRKASMDFTTALHLSRLSDSERK